MIIYLLFDYNLNVSLIDIWWILFTYCYVVNRVRCWGFADMLGSSILC